MSSIGSPRAGKRRRELHEPAPTSTSVLIGDKCAQAVPRLESATRRDRGRHRAPRPRFPCASNDGRNWLDPGDGTPIFVDELWDYSQCNIAACAEAAPTLRQRYVPPGFVPSTPVRPRATTSRAARLHRPAAAATPRACRAGGRSPPRQGKSRLARFQNAFDEEHLGAALLRSGVLNLHKRHLAGAAARALPRLAPALLLRARRERARVRRRRARVRRPRRRARAAAHLADAYLGVANKSRAEREAIAGERAARFATRFAPEALLRRAGVDALLRDLIARTSSKT